jgi:hypothetical protein
MAMNYVSVSIVEMKIFSQRINTHFFPFLIRLTHIFLIGKIHPLPVHPHCEIRVRVIRIGVLLRTVHVECDRDADSDGNETTGGKKEFFHNVAEELDA